LSPVPPDSPQDDSYWSLVAPYWSNLNEAWALGSDVFLARLEAIPVRSRDLYASHWCYSEVVNGGFYQFFYNTTGILAPESTSGFRAIGAVELAEVVAGAMLFFGATYPRDRELRLSKLGQFQNPDPAAIAFFEPFTKSFYAWCDTPRDRWERTADSYARSA
jgi:Domain of unknown function (DUF4375)